MQRSVIHVISCKVYAIMFWLKSSNNQTPLFAYFWAAQSDNKIPCIGIWSKRVICLNNDT